MKLLPLTISLAINIGALIGIAACYYALQRSERNQLHHRRLLLGQQPDKQLSQHPEDEMSVPLVNLPDPRFVRPFQIDSMQYWTTVAKIMEMTGATREATEAFVQAQRAAIPRDRG